ncbi:MAG: ABC transporter ATP-binding protein [Sulfurovum sp.]|nr:ABC transporter ATP-binding protein [Sulfurovum sp.]
MILEIDRLSKSFNTDIKKEPIRVLDCASITLDANEWVGVVGESGCGKSTLAKIIMQALSSDNGEIKFDNKSIKNLNKQELRNYYKGVQMVFQDPLSSFSPRVKIATHLSEALINFGICSKKKSLNMSKKLLEDVGLSVDKLHRYPSELSGGELQRVAIARAISVSPKIIIFDEATSALDVRTEAQIIKLLHDMKQTKNFSAIFISHNIALVHNIASRIYVMKDGKIVEEYLSKDIHSPNRREYTKLLIEAASLKI